MWTWADARAAPKDGRAEPGSEAGLGWKKFEEGTGLEGSVLCLKDTEHPCVLSGSEILPPVSVSRENRRQPAKCGFQMDKM